LTTDITDMGMLPGYCDTYWTDLQV